jgi:hypothetical protein
MTKIDSAEFGKIVIDHKTYDSDITIDASGKVAKRSSISETYYGTGHTICTEEIKPLLETKPQTIVIGTGQYGACRLEQGVSRACERQGAKLIVEKTPKAVEMFNKTEAKKAGLFHVTC